MLRMRTSPRSSTPNSWSCSTCGPWCGPCRQIAPILQQLSKDFAGRIKVVKVNVDDNRATSERFGVQSIPLVHLLKDGQSVDMILGAASAPTYRQRIEAALP